MAKKIDPLDNMPVSVGNMRATFERVADQSRRTYQAQLTLAQESGESLPLGLGLLIVGMKEGLALSRNDRPSRVLRWSEAGVLLDENGRPANIMKPDVYGSWGVREVE